jgi:hypothetical protein
VVPYFFPFEARIQVIYQISGSGHTFGMADHGMIEERSLVLHVLFGHENLYILKAKFFHVFMGIAFSRLFSDSYLRPIVKHP